MKTPSEGTIAFCDPQPRGAYQKGRRLLPVLITITTEAQKNRRADEATQTIAGSIPKAGAENRPTEPGARLKIFEEARSNSAYVTSPGRFTELWEALAGVGVFKLPRYRGGIPPENKPSIRLTTGGRTWIFLKPTDAPAEIPRDPEERAQIQGAWGRAKLLIVEFVP